MCFKSLDKWFEWFYHYVCLVQCIVKKHVFQKLCFKAFVT